jgi:hypothetical protein
VVVCSGVGVVVVVGVRTWWWLPENGEKWGDSQADLHII